MKIAATIISRMLDPFIVFFSLMIMASLQGGASGKELLFTLFVIVAGILVPPVSLLLWAVRTKKVTNWDVSNRKQRIWVFLIFILFLFIDVFIINSLHNEELSRFFAMCLVSFMGTFAITLFWKISGHLSTLAIAIGMIFHWYGFSWWSLFFLLPILCWSRVILKRHTLAQTIAGSIYGLLVVYIAATMGFV